MFLCDYSLQFPPTVFIYFLRYSHLSCSIHIPCSQQVLAESSAKPDSIASVAIQGFDLGEDPPRLRNIDVVDYGGGYSSSSSSSSGGQVGAFKWQIKVVQPSFESFEDFLPVVPFIIWMRTSLLL